MQRPIIRQHQLSIVLACATALGVVFLACASCTTNRAIRLKNKSIKEWSAFQWQEEKRSKDTGHARWIIHSRKIKGTPLFEYKIEGAIAASPTACLSAFRQDIMDQSVDPDNKQYPTYAIVRASTDSLLTYLVHHEPFPFKNTEMSSMHVFSDNEDGGTGVVWQEAWDQIQIKPSNKLSRVETFRGSWRFDRAEIRFSWAVNTLQFDPKGMPRWLVRPMVIKLLKTGLEDIRKQAA